MSEVALNEFVDIETGELLDPSLSVVVEDLPRLARQLRAIEKRAEIIVEYRDQEVARIRAICNRKLGVLGDSQSRLMAFAEGLMRGTGKERLEYPGLGVLRFGATRESVSDIEFLAFDEGARDAMPKQYPSLFVTKTITRPDKKAIMAELKNGRDIPGFKINQKRETFLFKAE